MKAPGFWAKRGLLAHMLAPLGAITAAKGDKMKAVELHGLARKKFLSLGMKRWAEGPG